MTLLENNLLQNCPITKTDILAAEDIFGPNLGSLKGKTVRHNTPHMRAETHEMLCKIMSIHHDVTLCADIMFVNQIPFLVTISRNVKFGTVEVL
jgi:hypothetical protein